MDENDSKVDLYYYIIIYFFYFRLNDFTKKNSLTNSNMFVAKLKNEQRRHSFHCFLDTTVKITENFPHRRL